MPLGQFSILSKLPKAPSPSLHTRWLRLERATVTDFRAARAVPRGQVVQRQPVLGISDTCRVDSEDALTAHFSALDERPEIDEVAGGRLLDSWQPDTLPAATATALSKPFTAADVARAIIASPRRH